MLLKLAVLFDLWIKSPIVIKYKIKGYEELDAQQPARRDNKSDIGEIIIITNMNCSLLTGNIRSDWKYTNLLYEIYSWFLNVFFKTF